MSSLRLIRHLVLAAAVLCAAPRADASESREFIMSCTYGVLAGTLVGAATLAFESQPGDKLYKVARGASLGLYAGIALGLYVVYGVSDEPDPNYYDVPGLPPPEGALRRSKRPSLPVVSVYPLMNERLQVDGASAQLRLLNF